MLHFIVGFVGLGLFGWAGTAANPRNAPEVLQGPIGKIVYWIVTVLSLFLVYWGWIRPWLSN